MANLSQIKLPNGTTYNIKDNGALQLTGGQVTGPVTFGDSVSIDEATLGDLVVNGSASFTNNIQANTINGVEVGSSPKFTDTVTTVTTSGSGNAVTAISASDGVITVTKGSTFLTGITSSQVTTALGYTPYNSTNPSGYTTNTGTVTKVTAGTGLSIGTTAGGNFTTSGTINHTNSVTAQTTQAVYPIKIDAQGHISAYGSAVTPLTASSTLDATKLSGTIPSSCYTDSDEKVKSVVNTDSATCYLLTTTKSTENTGTAVKHTTAKVQFSADSSTNGYTILLLGNDISKDTAGAKYGVVRLYGNSTYYTDLQVINASTANRTIKLPDANGTLVLTDNLPTISLNGSTTTSPSFYAPTTAGTNGYVLKSNGSGAPTWTSATLTDTKVTTAALTSGTLYYPILATGTGTATRQIDSTLKGLTYKSTAGTASVVGSAILTLGNNTGSGTANNEQGILHIYGENTYYTTLKANVSGGTKVISLPNKNGTLATTDDITDKKLQVDSLTSGTTYYPILASGTGTATRQIDSTLNGLTYMPTAGTTSIVGSAILTLGNNIAEGTANNEEGTITLYSNTQYCAALHAPDLSQNRALLLPDKDGTLATTDLANASNRGLMSNTDKIYLDGLSDAIGTTSSTITIKNGSSGGRAFYLETNSSDTDDTSLISAITSLGWDSDVIVS